jgi:hypothetical protein
MTESSRTRPYPRFYAVNDRPVKIIERPDAGLETFVFDWVSGGFIRDESYFLQIFGDPFKDVDTFSKFEFDIKIQVLRLPILHQLCSAPLVWADTGDAFVPYTCTYRERVFTIRINDFPEEPLYTLMFDDQELVDLEDWPTAWTRPEPPDALLEKFGLKKFSNV